MLFSSVDKEDYCWDCDYYKIPTPIPALKIPSTTEHPVRG
jgi:hypothetical protein